MSIPTWEPGEILASSDVNEWFVPLAAVKSADQSVTNSTTLVADNDLTLEAEANQTYVFEAVFFFTAASGADMKFQWNSPSGAVMKYEIIGDGSGGGSLIQNQYNSGSNQTLEGQGSGTFCAVTFKGVLIMSSTAGNVYLQWAQNSSNSTATDLRAGSYMLLRRIV